MVGQERQLFEEMNDDISSRDDFETQPLVSYASTINIERPEDLFAALQELPLRGMDWAFRGHARYDWPLAPTLERLAARYKDIRENSEGYLLKSFKRRAPQFLTNLPDDAEDLEWIALMRHHGTPTRLLDLTRSPFVAAFFATSEADEDKPSAIWAINIWKVRWLALQLFALDDPRFAAAAAASSTGIVEVNWDTKFNQNEFFRSLTMQRSDDPVSVVIPVQPIRTNERIVTQQSLFLCPNIRLIKPGVFGRSLKT